MNYRVTESIAARVYNALGQQSVGVSGSWPVWSKEHVALPKIIGRYVAFDVATDVQRTTTKGKRK